MPLLPLAAFAPVFEPLRGRRIGYVRTPGNVGDGLIEMAAFQLLKAFGIDFVVANPADRPPIDEWVIAGGGSMGSYYPACQRMRRQALADGRPVTVLPQSFITAEPFPYARVYVRERASLALRPDGVLAPDLALGLEWPCDVEPDQDEGVWLRRDTEGVFGAAPSLGDPAEHCRTPLDYLRLAARYRHVVTDRLHFAIAALHCGRKTTLLPNTYHKNRSMYDTWLRDLGCQWQGVV